MQVDERLDVPQRVQLDEQQCVMVHELELHVVLDEQLDVLLDELPYVQLDGLQCALALQGVLLHHLHTGERDELDTSGGAQWCGNQYGERGHQNDRHVHERMNHVRCTIHHDRRGVELHGVHMMRATHDL